MKKRKGYTKQIIVSSTLAMLLASSTLGIGYAAWNDTMQVNGTVSTGDLDKSHRTVSGSGAEGLNGIRDVVIGKKKKQGLVISWYEDVKIHAEDVSTYGYGAGSNGTFRRKDYDEGEKEVIQIFFTIKNTGTVPFVVNVKQGNTAFTYTGAPKNDAQAINGSQIQVVDTNLSDGKTFVEAGITLEDYSIEPGNEILCYVPVSLGCKIKKLTQGATVTVNIPLTYAYDSWQDEDSIWMSRQIMSNEANR